MNENPSFIRRLVSRIWQAINTTRRIVLNLLFVLILVLFISALFSDGDEIVVPETAALVLSISGDIVEQKREVDPIDALMGEAVTKQQETPEVLLQDIIDVIEHAQTDDNIKVLLLDLKSMGRSGLTKLSDIADAITEFKTSGKRVIAMADGYSQNQYYLASHADDVWIAPNGYLLLEGYGRYQLYFKTALEKLKVTQHIFRVGTYKSAVEPYIRDDMSIEAKEANQAWLDELWTKYKNDVASQRGFKVDNFDESLSDFITKFEVADGDFAVYAKQNGFVDEIKTRNEARQAIIELVGVGEHDSFNQVSFNDYLQLIKPPFPMVNPVTDKVAVVVAKGTILDGHQQPGTIGGDSTAALLKKARKDDKVKAVVLRVDSPGGSAYASEIIRQEVEALKKAGKPVIASMGTYAASGGYWISASANEIWAAPTTITGSIGIFGMITTFENTLKTLGINTDGVGTTEMAGFGLTRPMSDGMKNVIQLAINKGYKNFIELVAEHRNMSLEQVDSIAQGRVWTGKKALELGLVDKLGNLDDAIQAAADKAGLSHFDTVVIEKELSPQELFLRNLLNSSMVQLVLPVPEVTATNNVQKLVLTLTNELNQLLRLNDPQGMYSLCLTCEIN